MAGTTADSCHSRSYGVPAKPDDRPPETRTGFATNGGSSIDELNPRFRVFSCNIQVTTLYRHARLIPSLGPHAAAQQNATVTLSGGFSAFETLAQTGQNRKGTKRQVRAR